MKTVESTPTRSRRYLAGATAALSLAASLSACSSNTTQATSPDTTSTFTVKYHGSEWFIACQSEQDDNPIVLTARPGDNLLGLARRAGTVLYMPIEMSDPNVPIAVYDQVLADYNGISNPNLIYPDRQYRFPDSCAETTPVD